LILLPFEEEPMNGLKLVATTNVPRLRSGHSTHYYSTTVVGSNKVRAEDHPFGPEKPSGPRTASEPLESGESSGGDEGHRTPVWQRPCENVYNA